MLIQTLKTRREQLAKLTDKPVFIAAGKRTSRNFPANKYPFRASSHFLYFAGIAIESAVIQLAQGKLTLYIDNPRPGSALWHGESPTRDHLAATIGADYTYPLSELPNTISNFDDEITTAIVTLRLHHDDYAISEIRNAVEVTTRSHIAGMNATKTAKTEAEVRSAMEADERGYDHGRAVAADAGADPVADQRHQAADVRGRPAVDGWISQKVNSQRSASGGRGAGRAGAC